MLPSSMYPSYVGMDSSVLESRRSAPRGRWGSSSGGTFKFYKSHIKPLYPNSPQGEFDPQNNSWASFKKKKKFLIYARTSPQYLPVRLSCSRSSLAALGFLLFLATGGQCCCSRSHTRPGLSARFPCGGCTLRSGGAGSCRRPELGFSWPSHTSSCPRPHSSVVGLQPLHGPTNAYFPCGF